MKVTIFDYGAGNLHSLAKAIEAAGVETSLETNPVAAVDTDVLILPGVGAFGAAAERLAPGRVAIRRALQDGLPCLGICLGMQLLLEQSDEGDGEGIGLIPGVVRRLDARRVPHIGWNSVDDARDPLFARVPLHMAYFANSYVCRPANEDSVTAWTTHESDRFPATIRHGQTVGVQFHPEKSSGIGVQLIHAFLDEVKR